MEWSFRPPFQDIGACGIQLRVQTSERVVDGCGAENAYTLSLTLLGLEPLRLDDNTQTLDEENTAQSDEHQLFMDDDGTYTDDAANSQRPRVALQNKINI